MTTANKITLFRTLLVPVFVYAFLCFREDGILWVRWVCLGTFAVVAILDGVDGFVARRFHQKSELGGVLDPLADKLLLVSGIVLLALPENRLERLPIWLPLIILTRDVLLVIGWGVIQSTCGSVNVRPRISGKISTVVQMVVLIWALLGLSVWIQFWIAVVAGIMTLWSGIAYAGDAIRQLSESPRSGPTPGQ
ncbi:MAG: CDP-alcohol phosphatidyltransferase family protein [Pedosphaera sp.]|nr:CDP-alcohol phosphatidyltransferase family protein [Pedosphaera sp.]